MGLLKDVKNNSSQIEQERMEQANELLSVREELVGTRKREESERRERAEEKRAYKDQIDQVSQERTLKESELQA